MIDHSYQQDICSVTGRNSFAKFRENFGNFDLPDASVIAKYIDTLWGGLIDLLTNIREFSTVNHG